MSLPDDIQYDRRSYGDDSGGDGKNRRHDYRRKEDVMREDALKGKQRSRWMTIAAALVIAGAIAANVIIGVTGSNSDKTKTGQERQSRLTNVSELCNGVNAIRSYVAVAANKFQQKLSPPPPRLNCAALLANTANER